MTKSSQNLVKLKKFRNEIIVNNFDIFFCYSWLQYRYEPRKKADGPDSELQNIVCVGVYLDENYHQMIFDSDDCQCGRPRVKNFN